MNSLAMPNLVGLRDIPPTSMENPAKEDTLKAIQREALGITRREHLSTTDFKENKSTYVSTVALESRRLVNKSNIGKGEKSKLEGWNNAWTRLQDDGTDSQKLQDVNEGMGQTHRAKLMESDSVREYTGESNIRGGGRSGRGARGDHGGRGGGNAGRVTGRSGRAKGKEERRVTPQILSHRPITRVRVPKEHRPTTQPDVPHRHPAPTLTTVSAVRSAKPNSNIPSVPVATIRRPVVLAAPSAFMASLNIRKEQPQDQSSIKIAPSSADTTEEEAARHSIGASISNVKRTASSSNKKAIADVSNTSATGTPNVNTTTAAGKPAVSVQSRPKADLMDLEISQETIQPVLQFTAPGTKKQPCEPVIEVPSSFDQKIEALEKSGVLSATQLETLKTIQAQVHAHANPLSPPKEAPRQGFHTRSELEFLRPTTAASKVTGGIARKLAEQQNAFLIGEHVHKTRYHTAASLTEDFEKLSISDKKPAELAARDISSTKTLRMILDKKSAKPAATNLSTIEKSKINPFGPPPTKGKGPSLPAHLLNRTATADHGAAARAQYLGGNDISGPVSDQQPLGDVTAPTRPARRNKINETGFIALAENRAAEKKGEDPLLVAHKRGL